MYRHNDLSHLDQLLTACPSGARKLIVTDSLFSMDGDFADLKGLVALKRRHNSLLVVGTLPSVIVLNPSGVHNQASFT